MTVDIACTVPTLFSPQHSRQGRRVACANLIAGRDVEPAFSWGFFDRLLLIVTERVGELVVVFGDQIDIALVLDRGDRRLQRVIELGKCFLLVAGRHFLVGLNLRICALMTASVPTYCLVAASKPAST